MHSALIIAGLGMVAVIALAIGRYSVRAAGLAFAAGAVTLAAWLQVDGRLEIAIWLLAAIAIFLVVLGRDRDVRRARHRAAFHRRVNDELE